MSERGRATVVVCHPPSLRSGSVLWPLGVWCVATDGSSRPVSRAGQSVRGGRNHYGGGETTVPLGRSSTLSMPSIVVRRLVKHGVVRRIPFTSRGSSTRSVSDISSPLLSVPSIIASHRIASHRDAPSSARRTTPDAELGRGFL